MSKARVASPPAKTYPEWVDTIGVGKVEWSRKWARIRAQKSVRWGNQYDWVYNLKLTAKLGGHSLTYQRYSIEELQHKRFPKAVMDEIIAAYVELQLATASPGPDVTYA
jgi:hypothetical protein